MMLLSIIIPVHNLQDYLLECLSSITCQSTEQLEIIIVNDGSTDSSRKIANSYAQKYNSIKVIHQSNQGVSAARNKGLLYATGEYIWFVDGDDLIDDKSIYILIQTIKNHTVDVIFFKYKNFFNKLDADITANLGVKEILVQGAFIDRFPKLLEERLLSYSPCDKVTRRQFLLENHIQFDTSFISAEDYYWNYECFKYINNFLYLNTVFYHYRKNRVNSATTLLSNSHLHSALNALEITVSDMEYTLKDNYSLKYFFLYSSQLFFYNMPEFYKARLVDKEIEKRFYDVYKKYRANKVELSQYNSGAKVFGFMYRYLSFGSTSYVYSKLINLKRYLQFNVFKRMK